MSNHMFLQACLIVSGGLVIGAAPKEKTIFTTISRHRDAQQKGWKSIFNGKNLAGWRTYQQKESDAWSVQNGVLYCKGNTDNNTKHADLLTEESLKILNYRSNGRLPKVQIAVSYILFLKHFLPVTIADRNIS